MVKKILCIKFGELYLKGKNKFEFINCLFDNIKRALNDFNNIKFDKYHDSIKIYFYQDNDKDNIINILKFIPGIAYIIETYELERNLDLLENLLLEILNSCQTFKLNIKRIDKNYFDNSREVINELANRIFNKNNNIKVDVHNPDKNIFIIITKDVFSVYFKKIKGIGGLPVGINGRVLMLISGGIDSPVASFLLQKRGLIVDYISFFTPPHTSKKSEEKVKLLVDKISLNNKIFNSKLYIVDFSPILHELNHIERKSYRIILMRRSFIRIAAILANKISASAIATGDNIGQVASQTIESINVISEASEGINILRPLLTYDKIEIINIAKEIGTYDISILPYEDSCSLFVPKNPIIKPSLEDVKELESKNFLINDLENIIIKSIK